ncbi:UspA domain-containing protein [[Leptolyngbya] sp. PCC 7376]|uniref:universal stress protein n=1 Tax=[Leptolyngbya] sp. PCC 7376 TaxID=111781 RepID=UPI00029EFBAD|nr:universal stress protein [[Leptolyngbya] sp. PCC 7376]AFY38451.1 UspA domain-containing protein [[Leptolyngbya] sp. PCC 7376]
MISKILVALDYLADTPQIFEQALTIAEKFQANLYIFHGVEPQLNTVPEMSAMAAYGGLLDAQSLSLREKEFENNITEMSAWLQALAKQASDRHIPVEVNYKIGEPKVEICNAAKESEADLIIVGRRGLRGISEVLIGSVSSYVVHHAPCSVMVVQHQ